MVQISEDYKINIDTLTENLLKGRVKKFRFRLPYTHAQVRDMVVASLKAEVKYRNRVFSENEFLNNQIEDVAKWLTSQNKVGLLLCGVPGNGKTTMMIAIRSLINFLDIKDDCNERLGVNLIDAREIARLNKDAYEQFRKVREKPMLAIDDMGIEPIEVLDYGNVLNPVIDLLSYRYNEQLFTIVTTNLSPKQIREKYGARIADRFNEMMEKIVFDNKSYRSD